MYDSFITALNTQKTTMDWMEAITKNLSNIYTPGYKEVQSNFKTFLDGSMIDDLRTKTDQGKAVPGTSPSNIYLEGEGFFVMKDENGKSIYTRLGEFTFDGEGLYKSSDGKNVQGYILNDNGEIMAGAKPQNIDPNTGTSKNGGPADIATTNIKLWIDPSNGKYLGKYEEYEIKEDGILYGKADKGKIKVPLYKIAVMNFHNPGALTEVKENQYVENKFSGNPVAGRGEIRSGMIEMANTDFKANIAYFQQAKMQMELTNKLISSNKQLLEEAMRLIQ